MTKVINLYGGPGTGKSTTAAALFALMKLNGYSVELVTEYAKQLVWDDREHTLANQGYVFAKQNHKLAMLRGKVDYIVTDSPLPLSAIYGLVNGYYPSFKDYCLDVFDSYENINFFLTRVKKYVTSGRTQTESEAVEIDQIVRGFLSENAIDYITVRGDSLAAQSIMEIVTGAIVCDP